MKLRIVLAVVTVSLIIWSCDDPIAYDNPSFVYNPFSFHEDTLNNVVSITPGEMDIEWGAHFRTWVGETQYYKSGFSVEIGFADTSLDILGADSIVFELKHVKTYSENGNDTLPSTYSRFSYYDTRGQTVDIANNVYGTLLGSDSTNIKGSENNWSFNIPVGTIGETDTSISLSLFPEDIGYLSSVYGGGSVSRPALKFFYHEPDTGGIDSATYISYLADTLYSHLIEQAGVFDRDQYNYLSQLRSDSLTFNIDVSEFIIDADTLQHVISSMFLPAIDSMASSLYKPDTSFVFSMRINEPETGYTLDLELGGIDIYNQNQIKFLIQPAIDEGRSNIDLIIKPSNPGYNPGFIAISKDVTQSAIFVHTSKAVQP